MHKFLICVLACAMSCQAPAASFDCSKAKSRAELLICSDPELSRLDERAADAFKQKLATPGANRSEIMKEQRQAWHKREAECTTKQCLFAWYTGRLKALGASGPIAPANTISADFQPANQSAPFADAIAAQRSSIAAVGRAKQQADDTKALKRRMEETNRRVLAQLYYSAKAAGIKMTDPMPKVNSLNVARDGQGIWRLEVASSQDAGMLLTLLDFGDPSFAFNVAGVGLIISDGSVQDPNWPPVEGKPLTAGCQYEVSVGFSSRSYACAPFASGALNKTVLTDMQAMLSAEIQRAAKQRVGNGQ